MTPVQLPEVPAHVCVIGPDPFTMQPPDPTPVYTAAQLREYATEAVMADRVSRGVPPGWTIRERDGEILVSAPLGTPGAKWLEVNDRGTLDRRLLIALAQALLTPSETNSD